MEHLIPDAWFVGQHWLLLTLFGAIGLYLLSLGADWLVEAASLLAERVGVPKIVIGATVVSLGTTTPECAVSVMAAINGNAGLALGNAVGSVIFDTAVIFGLGSLIVALPADRFLLQRQGWVQFGSGVLLAVVCYLQFYRHGDAATIPMSIGIVLLALLAVYLWVSVHWSRQQVHAAEVGEPLPTHHKPKPVWRLLLEIVIGLAFVLVGSRVTIAAVTELAHQLNVPDVVISATIVAFGTSLPELIVGLAAIRKKHAELLVGNVIGADVLNILFVTGAAACAKPLPLVDLSAGDPYVFLKLQLPAMLAVLVLFRIFIAMSVKKGQFQRWMGAPLLVIYLIFMGLSFVMGANPNH